MSQREETGMCTLGAAGVGVQTRGWLATMTKSSVLPHEGMLPVSVCRRCAASMRCGTGDLLNLRADLACYRAIDFFVPASLLATNAL